MSTIQALPATIHIEVQQETDQYMEFQLTDGTNAVDLTLDTVKLTARDSLGGTIKVQKTNPSGSHSAPLLGKTMFLLSKTDLTTGSRASSAEWVYEVRRIMGGSNQELVYMQGKLSLRPVVGL